MLDFSGLTLWLFSPQIPVYSTKKYLTTYSKYQVSHGIEVTYILGRCWELNGKRKNGELGHNRELEIGYCSSVQFTHSVVSNSLWPHESKHARPPCPSPTPGVHPDSHPSSQWCHPAVSSSVVPFSCPQSLQASESFPMSQLFTWDGQSTAVSALASFLPKKSQGWSPSEWTGWISLQSKEQSLAYSKCSIHVYWVDLTQSQENINSIFWMW